jgi:hypothetical protein
MRENVEVRSYVKISYLRFLSVFRIRIRIRSTFFGTFYESACHISKEDPVPEGKNVDPVPKGRKSAKSKRINKTLYHGCGSGSVSGFKM